MVIHVAYPFRKTPPERIRRGTPALVGVILLCLLLVVPDAAPAAEQPLPAGQAEAVNESASENAPPAGEPQGTADSGAAGNTAGKAAADPPQGSAGESKDAPKPIRLFGTVEFRSPIKNLPKWERVRNSESKLPSFTPKGLDTENRKVAERWAKLKDSLKGMPLKDQVRGVNNFFNQWPYKTDLVVWGVEDYWATPREFVLKSGDCEDYAIAKYYALRDLGVPAAMLRIAAVKDTIRGLGHAILVVFMENDAYILDNLTNLVLSHKKLTHYAPQYTVNEEFLWRHVKPKSAPGR